MFILLAMGYCLRIKGLVDDDSLTKMNKMIFRAFFPFLMFTNIYGSNITEVVDPFLIIYTVGAILTVYAIATLIVLKIEPSNKSRGAMIQAIYRSNFVIMGLPIATNIYGHGNVGVTAVMVAIVVPLYNVIAVITLELYRGRKVSIKDLVLRIAKNPLILGAAAGLLCVLLHIKLPHAIDSTISQLSAATTPIALIVLGGSFKFNDVKEQMRNLTISVVSRLIIVPGVVLSLAACLGIKGIAFVTLVGIFAAPCALSSFTMAQEMESDGRLAGSTVVFTSALCSITMFIWLFVFKSMGVF